MKKYENLNMIVCISEDNLVVMQIRWQWSFVAYQKEELLYFKSITLGHTFAFW